MQNRADLLLLEGDSLNEKGKFNCKEQACDDAETSECQPSRLIIMTFI